MDNLNKLLKLNKEERQEYYNSKTDDEKAKLFRQTLVEVDRLLEDISETSTIDEAKGLVMKVKDGPKNLGGRPKKSTSVLP